MTSHPCDIILGSDFIIGIGPEDCTTPGVQSTNITYLEVEEFDDGAQKTYTEKRVAAARRDNVTRQIENDRFSDGTIGGTILQETFGLVLRGVLGVPTTNILVAGTDFEHCFTPEPSACLCTSSIVFSDPAKTFVVNNAVFKELTISGEAQGDLTYSAAFEGKFPVEDTLVTTLFSETAFEPKQFKLYVGDDIASIDAGIVGATIEPLCLQSFDLTLANDIERRYCFGDTDPDKIISTAFNVTGSFTVEYNTTTCDFINDWINEALRALKIVIEDTDNPLPGANNPTLTIDINQIHYDSAPRDTPIDGVSSVTVEFTGQLKIAEDQTIQICLINGNDGTMYLP